MALSEEIKDLTHQEAIVKLTEYLALNPKDDEAYNLRGMKYWSLGQRKEAVNDFLTAVRLNQESDARMMLEFSDSIFNYYNKDILNP